MAKRITQLSELTTAAQDDYIVIVDTSTGTTKKITVKNLTGLPDVGWIASGETWSYSAWNSTLKQATITVPSDATTKYQEDMFIRFAQATGGTKYGKIMSVTSTTLVVYMGSYTLNNEAISSPVYSPLASPIGVAASIAKYNPYKFLIYRNAAWTDGASAYIRVQHDTTVFDTNANADIVTTKGRYTAPVTGIYDFQWSVSKIVTAGAAALSLLYKNGVATIKGNEAVQGAASVTFTSTGSAKLELTAGDYVEVFSYGSGGAGNVGVGNTMFAGECSSRK